MARRLEEHDRLARETFSSHHGYVFSTAGDSFAVAFHTVANAVRAAADFQTGLTATPVRVRVGIHHGRSIERDGDYFGPVVNTAARIMSAAHGGQVLISAEAAGHVDPAAGIETIDLGDHRLKDVDAPTHLLQVAVPGQAPDFPPLRSLDRFVSTLPPRRRRLIGRDAEINEVRRALSAHRLVTLWGPGGAGKTSLALAAAESAQHAHADGARLVDLTPARNLDGVLAAFGSGALLRLESEGDPAERVAADLQGHRCLVVIDNCEHVIEDVARITDVVLDLCPEVVLLATSREPLRIVGEHLVPVGGLGGDEVAVRDDPAVELLLDRVRTSGAAWRPSAEDLDSCRDLVRGLDRLPLAIELAAARLPHLPVAVAREQLADSLQLLRGRTRGAPERHSTLTAALDWSVDQLDPGPADAHRELGVMRGSFDLAAAAAVLDADETAAALLMEDLFSKALLVLEPGDRARYRQLETVRRHGSARLDDDRRRAAWRRHAEHFGALARRRFEQDPTHTSDLSPAVEYDADEPNLIAALERSERAPVPGTVPYLVLANSFQWVLRNEQELMSRWFGRALAEEGVDPNARCVLMTHHALSRPPSEMVALVGAAREYGRAHAPDLAVVPESVVASIPCVLMQPEAAARAAEELRAVIDGSAYRRVYPPLATYFEGAAASVGGDQPTALRKYREARSELGNGLWDWTMWFVTGAAVALILDERPSEALRELAAVEIDVHRFRTREQIAHVVTRAAARAAAGDADGALAELAEEARRFVGSTRYNDTVLAGFAAVRSWGDDPERARDLFDLVGPGLAAHLGPLLWHARARAAHWDGSISEFAGQEFLRQVTDPRPREIVLTLAAERLAEEMDRRPPGGRPSP